MSMKRLSALVASMAVATLLASCAPGEVIDDSTTQPPATGTGTETGGETPDGGQTTAEETGGSDPADFSGKTLSYVYFTDGPDEQATRDLIAQFEEEHDVTVELEVLAYADLVTSVLNRLSGGNPPDVVRLTALTDFRNDLLVLDDHLGADYINEFLEGPGIAVTNDDGQMIAVPSDLTMNGPFINVDLFNEAGVELPDPEDPWTWEEMIEAGTAIKEATGIPYAFAMDKSGHRLSTILSQYGTVMVDSGGLALDTAKAAEALQPLVDMMAADDMPRDFWLGSGSRYEGANEIFLAGDTPIYLSGNWQVGQFAQNAEFEWTVAPNPCAEECGGFPGGKFMAAFKDAAEPELAAEFIRFMNTAESQSTFLASFGALPTRVDLAESGVEYPTEWQDALDVFIADLNRTPTNGYEANGNPAFSPSATALVEEMSEVVAGNKDMATAMTDTEAKIQGILDELGSW
ncbi:MAG: extracellular solute-binding protein [bacterium]|nr:extracellular solute-binding protein [bacterium]